MENPTKNYYAVVTILQEAEISLPFGKQSLPFSGLADGCMGVLLVFSERKDAEAFANGKGDILKLEQKPIDEGM